VECGGDASPAHIYPCTCLQEYIHVLSCTHISMHMSTRIYTCIVQSPASASVGCKVDSDFVAKFLAHSLGLVCLFFESGRPYVADIHPQES